MSDKKLSPDLAEELGTVNDGCTDAICADISRVYDSCADKDCVEDLRVYFTDTSQAIVDTAVSVKCRGCEIINCYIDVEPTPFNRGYYTVDSTFFFKNTFDVFSSSSTTPTTVDGLSTFTKKCILYGSEGSVKVFSSEYSSDNYDNQTVMSYTNPKAKLQAVDPICLSTSVFDVDPPRTDTITVPAAVASQFEGSFEDVVVQKVINVTLGMFIIIQLERDVQMLIPAYDFCIPQKECNVDDDTPCDAFRRINFPVDEFFPPNADNLAENGGGNPGCCGGR